MEEILRWLRGEGEQDPNVPITPDQFEVDRINPLWKQIKKLYSKDERKSIQGLENKKAFSTRLSSLSFVARLSARTLLRLPKSQRVNFPRKASSEKTGSELDDYPIVIELVDSATRHFLLAGHKRLLDADTAGKKLWICTVYVKKLPSSSSLDAVKTI